MPRGGRRPGAGRKPKAITLVKKTLTEANADAETALGFVIALMENDSIDVRLRFECAKEVMDRVWGKATQKRELSGADGGPLIVRWLDDRDSDPVPTTRRTASVPQ